MVGLGSEFGVRERDRERERESSHFIKVRDKTSLLCLYNYYIFS